VGTCSLDIQASAFERGSAASFSNHTQKSLKSVFEENPEDFRFTKEDTERQRVPEQTQEPNKMHATR